MKKNIILIVIFYCLRNSVLLSESINESNISEQLEYAYINDADSIFTELIVFLKPKWNLDTNYAAQTLGFLTGYMSNNEYAIDYYNRKRFEFKNRNLVNMIDGMLSLDFQPIMDFLTSKRLQSDVFLWHIYFGNGNEESLCKLVDLYAGFSSNDTSLIMTIRYYYERHSEIKHMVDNREESFFRNVQMKTYSEHIEEFWSEVRNLAGKGK